MSNMIPNDVRPGNRAVRAGLFASLLAYAAGTTVALAQTEPYILGSQESMPEIMVNADGTVVVEDISVGADAAFENVQVEDAPADAGLDSFASAEEAATPDATEDVGAPAKNADSKVEGTVAVDDAQIVDLHVKDEDLANVLEMLSIQSQKNIIASKGVTARVTANLYGVTFYEALDAILHVNGYGYIEDGNFVKVYTIEELEKIQQAQRQKVSKVLFLNYMSSVDASEFVKPLLSVEGQIKVNGKAETFPNLGDVPVGNEQYAHSSMLVVFDYPENVAQIEEMVRQLDTKPAQVLVEATILQTQLNEANALGVDFSVLADMSFSEFTSVGPLAAAQTMAKGFVEDSSSSGTGGSGGTGGTGGGGKTRVPAGGGGTAISQTVGQVQSGNGGMKIGIVSNDVAVFLRVLDEVSDTTVVSNPKVLALNRQAARVLVGRKVGYLNTTSTDTATTQSVEFLDTGTQLYFRPFVSSDGIIRMELRPAVSEAAIRTASDVSGANITIPDEITNELVTNVLVRDGQTIVLGGLFRESTTVTRKQVPFLGDIPILGNAFRGHDDQTNRNEIIFLITPTIINDDALAEAGKRSVQYMDNVLSGAREGVLSWSRDRLTGSMNVEAEKLAREGKTKEALYKTDRSLYLNPNQPSMVALREKLTGEVNEQANRSFLERVLHGEEATTFRASEASRKTNLDELLNNIAPANDTAVATQPSEESTNEVFENEVVQPAQQPEIQFAEAPVESVSSNTQPAPSLNLLGTVPGYSEPAVSSNVNSDLVVAEALVGEPVFTSDLLEQPEMIEASEQTFASSEFETVQPEVAQVEIAQEQFVQEQVAQVEVAPQEQFAQEQVAKIEDAQVEVTTSDSQSFEVAAEEVVSEEVASDIASSDTFVAEASSQDGMSEEVMQSEQLAAETDAVVNDAFEGAASAFEATSEGFVAETSASDVAVSNDSWQPEETASASDNWVAEASASASDNWVAEASASSSNNWVAEASSNDAPFASQAANSFAKSNTNVFAVPSKFVAASSRKVTLPAPTGYNGSSPAWYMVMNRYYEALRKAEQNNTDSQHAFTNAGNEPTE